MKGKNKFIVSEKLQKEFAETRKKIASGERKRERLLKKIAEKPSEKLRNELALLDESIAEHRRRLPSSNLLELLEYFDNFAAQMFEMVDGYDDRLLLTMGDDAPQWQVLALIRENRNVFHDSDNPNIAEMVHGMDGVLGKLSARIEEKRRRAAERFPDLARSLKPREYEMPEEYNRLLKEIVGFVEKRDKLAKDLKFAIPEKRGEFLRLIAEFDKIINEAEEKLAEMYERHQKKGRYEDGLRKHLKEGSKRELKELREHLKKNPTSNGVLERILRDEFPE